MESNGNDGVDLAVAYGEEIIRGDKLLDIAAALLAYAECEEAHHESLLPSTNGGTGDGRSYFEVFHRHGWEKNETVYGFLNRLRGEALAKAHNSE